MLQTFISIFDSTVNKTYWASRFSSTDSTFLENARSVIDGSGNVYSVFSGGSSPTTSLTVVKQNADADIIWRQTIGPSNYTFAPKGITVDTGGNPVIWGTFANVSPYYSSGFIIKIDSNGSPVWDRKITGTDPFDFNDLIDVALTSNNSIGIAVTTNSQSWGGFDIVPMRLNSSGNLSWRSVLGDGQTQTSSTVTHDTGDNLLIAGITYVSSITGDNLFLSKINTSGGIAWSRYWQGNGTFNRAVYTINRDDLDNIYLITASRSRDGASVIKFDSNGSIVWQKKFSVPSLGGTTEPLGISVKRSTGEVFVAFYNSSNPSSAMTLLWTATLDTSGGLLWSRELRLISGGFGFAANIDCRGSVGGNEAIVLLSGSSLISNFESWVVKLPRTPLAVGQFGEFAVTNDYPISVINDTWGSPTGFTSNGGVPNLINPSVFGSNISASTNVDVAYTSYTGG